MVDASGRRIGQRTDRKNFAGAISEFVLPCYYTSMSDPEAYDYILIREASVLVRVTHGIRDLDCGVSPEFYDVRTGVQLKQIYPDLQPIELHRGHVIPSAHAYGIMRRTCEVTASEFNKVVNILEVKQRKLDSVVADSILDQLRVISDLLKEFLNAAEKAEKEDRFWLAQQVLGMVRKFSGRELSDLQETVEWFKNHYKK
ncbi:MAG: hypothetical protein HY912_20615 [Desulfomonile tiedjei]|uniref:Uncharacterized protein n=1 Tax=Desulfomonile tiedjei TaxID=2358 RepID=A0A9D6VAJ4_9BACT|nr:hypothetical protein [Desulfomonile tiedjei]